MNGEFFGGMQAFACFAGFDAAMFSFYSLVPYVLQWSGVAVLNLSLLSSDLWAGAARAFLFGESLPFLKIRAVNHVQVKDIRCRACLRFALLPCNDAFRPACGQKSH